MAFKPQGAVTQQVRETPDRRKYDPPQQVQSTSVEEPQNVRGKRGQGSYSQLCGQIPKDLHRRFKAKVVLEGGDIATKLEELVRAFTDEQSV